MPFNFEQVIFELGKLAGTEKTGGIDQERRQDFGIAVLLGVHLQKETDQSAFEAGAQAAINGEAGGGDLGGSFHIENVERRAQVPVRLRLKIKFPRFTPTMNLDVLIRTAARRNRCMRDVGNAC